MHWRELTPLAGDGDTGRLPIQRATGDLQELIQTKPPSGVRSPPGSGKTTFLPELLLQWVQHRWCEGTVVIVLPTQYACQKIKESLVEFRGWPADRIRLITGADKEDILQWGHTQFTITTYGMMWHWITKIDGWGLRGVLAENFAFLLDELA